MTGGAAPHDGPVTLVSFDVDGTLIRSCGEDANRLHKEAFTYGFKKVFGIDTHIDVVAHHGGTDPLIAVKVLEHHGVPREQVRAVLCACARVLCVSVSCSARTHTHTHRPLGLGL
jgi:hypothetical protein